ncbi:MAG: response regulator, partial [Acidimicrobiales bacterium]
LLAMVLGRVGRVRAVPDAYQALAWLGTEPVDVMVLDLMLPGANGVQLLERARQQGRSVPTVIVTGLSGPNGLGARAADAGAALIITKPFDANLLRAGVVEAAGAGAA